VVANGKLAASTLRSIAGTKLRNGTANAFQRAINDAKKQGLTISTWGIASGYRDLAMQAAMRKAFLNRDLAAMKKYAMDTRSTVVPAAAGNSYHGWGLAVDIKTSDRAKAIRIMGKYGFKQVFGAADPNHMLHDGKTAIAPLTGGTVTIEGVDYSYSRPTAKQLKDAGKHFAIRYVTVPGKGNKGIDQAEYDALIDAGIAVVAVFELEAQDMKKGKSKGMSDAKAAQAGLERIKGLGDNHPIYFTVDWDATPADQTAINAYLDGAASVLGRDRVGIYGGYYPVKRAKDAKKATWFWQTLAWSGGQILDGLHLYQYKVNTPLGSGTVDLVRAYKTEYGQHNVPTAAPAPAKPATPVTAPVETKPVETTKPTVLTATAEYNGIYFFKGDASPDVFIYEPVSGTKRHMTPAEWTIIKGYGHGNVLTIPQAQADQVPS
jgi:hypothetical protein